MLKLSIKDKTSMSRICNALSTELRLSILEAVQYERLSIVEIARKLDCSVSTIAANVKVLEESGLLVTELCPAKNGSMKLCSTVYFDALLQLHVEKTFPDKSKKYVVELPIGHYTNCDIDPSCGLHTGEDYIGRDDDAYSFYLPERIHAQLLWFRKGYVEYKFPVDTKIDSKISAIEFKMEICSEAPGYNNIWKSDITFWINNIEIGTWTCPGDFGDRQGRLSPHNWDKGNTQYGLLKTWKVDNGGSTISGEYLSPVSLNKLGIGDMPYVPIKIGIKEASTNQGGVNIFGKKFGDYEQDIVMIISY